MGAQVVLAGDVYDEAYDHACKLAEENGLTFIHPFNDLGVTIEVFGTAHKDQIVKALADAGQHPPVGQAVI